MLFGLVVLVVISVPRRQTGRHTEARGHTTSTNLDETVMEAQDLIIPHPRSPDPAALLRTAQDCGRLSIIMIEGFASPENVDPTDEAPHLWCWAVCGAFKRLAGQGGFGFTSQLHVGLGV